nr:chromosome partitioning protein ParB [Ramlibacter alkalitolerans]
MSAARPSAGKAAPTLSELADKPETVRLSVILEADVHTQLKIMAASERKTVSDIVRNLVIEQLKAHGEKKSS